MILSVFCKKRTHEINYFELPSLYKQSNCEAGKENKALSFHPLNELGLYANNTTDTIY